MDGYEGGRIYYFNSVQKIKLKTLPFTSLTKRIEIISTSVTCCAMTVFDLLHGEWILTA